MQAFALKAGLTPITSLLIQSSDLLSIATQLRDKAKQAPKMFERLPCVLDFSQLRGGSASLDLKQLTLCCREFGLMPIGVRNLHPDQLPLLEVLSLSDFGTASTKEKSPSKTKTSEAPVAADNTSNSQSSTDSQAEIIAKPATTVHKFPVRSGQQLRADGDLIIYGLVSAGAEVLAGGSITIFGPLRGRALAGIRGDAHSTISCQSMEAELVAVAGEYKLFEEQHQDPKAAVIQLDNGRLNILDIS